jgi:hypothetical protein
MGLASRPSTAQSKPLPMIPGDTAPDKRVARLNSRAQPHAAGQIRRRPKFNHLESENPDPFKASFSKCLDASKLVPSYQSFAPKTVAPIAKTAPEICSICSIKKLNVSTATTSMSRTNITVLWPWARWSTMQETYADERKGGPSYSKERLSGHQSEISGRGLRFEKSCHRNRKQ